MVGPAVATQELGVPNAFHRKCATTPTITARRGSGPAYSPTIRTSAGSWRVASRATVRPPSDPRTTALVKSSERADEQLEGLFAQSAFRDDGTGRAEATVGHADRGPKAVPAQLPVDVGLFGQVPRAEAEVAPQLDGVIAEATGDRPLRPPRRRSELAADAPVGPNGRFAPRAFQRARRVPTRPMSRTCVPATAPSITSLAR